MPRPPSSASLSRLRKHSDYQRVYRSGRKQFSKEMSFFFALRPALGADGLPVRGCPPGARVGLTVPKALGKAHDRNRIKRRLREAVRASLPLLAAPVDVVLHPRRSALTLPSADLRREVRSIFLAVERKCGSRSAPSPGATHSPTMGSPAEATAAPR